MTTNATIVRVPIDGFARRRLNAGSFDLLFTFPPVPTQEQAEGETAGYIDSLLSTLDGVTFGSGYAPVASDIRVVDFAGQYEASFTLHVHFTEDADVDGWLDSSGLLDSELVTIVPSPVTWTLTEDAHASLVSEARINAIDSSKGAVLDYEEALEGEEAKVVEILELSQSVEVREPVVLKQPMTLREYLDIVPEALVTVHVGFTIEVTSAE